MSTGIEVSVVRICVHLCSSVVTNLLRPRNDWRWCLAIVGIVLLTGCAARRPADQPVPTQPIKLIAVLEIELAPGGASASASDGETQRRLPRDAGRAITGQIYSVLANRSDIRFVPDLTIGDAAGQPSITGAASGAGRALALGKAVTADGVIFGSVSRFDERVGTELGATQPASVAFDLALLETATDQVIWRGQFAQTQEALTSNLLRFWMFWKSGPRWISARELSRLGVEQLIDEMRKTIATDGQKRSWWPWW